MNLRELYDARFQSKHGMAPHMPILRALAGMARTCVEFGVNGGCSTLALLMSCTDVHSYDIQRTAIVDQLEGETPRWRFYLEDSRTAIIPECDLLVLDSLHTYDQVSDELARHAIKVARFLVFHDTVTFGSVGADGETGKQDPEKLGIMPAILEFLAANRDWRVMLHITDSHGFLVLERRP